MYYVTLEIDADGEKEAEKTAEVISDVTKCRLVGCYPDFQTELDNDGQVVIYTGYIHPTHGA